VTHPVEYRSRIGYSRLNIAYSILLPDRMMEFLGETIVASGAERPREGVNE